MCMPFLKRATAPAPVTQLDRLLKLQSLTAEEHHRRQVLDATVRGLIEDAVEFLDQGRTQLAHDTLKLVLEVMP